jgi:hypothetical protein
MSGTRSGTRRLWTSAPVIAGTRAQDRLWCCETVAGPSLGRQAFLDNPADGLDGAYSATHTDELVVDRGDLDNLQPFGQRKDGSVNVPKGSGDELSHQLGGAASIVIGWIDNGEARAAASDRIKELQLQRRTVTNMVAQEVAGLTEHWFGEQELPGPFSQQARACRMLPVAPIEGRYQRAGIAEELSPALRLTESIASTISRSRRASAMISRYRADRSGSPKFTRPTQGKRRRTGP